NRDSWPLHEPSREAAKECSDHKESVPRPILHQPNAPTPQIANNGIKLASPRNPTNCPRLNAPCPPPASAMVNIESRVTATCPDQNVGHTECISGQLSCIDNCEVVEITISPTATLHTNSAI